MHRAQIGADRVALTKWVFDDSEVHQREKMVIFLDAHACALKAANDAVDFSARLSIPE